MPEELPMQPAPETRSAASLAEELFQLPMGDEIPPEWQIPGSIQLQLEDLSKDVIPSSSSELAAPTLTPEQKAEVFRQLRELLTLIKSESENKTREEVINIIYLARLRLTQVGISQLEIPSDILEIMDSITETIKRDDKRRQELLLAVQQSMSEEVIDIDPNQVRDIDPQTLTGLLQAGDESGEKALELSGVDARGSEWKSKITETNLLFALLVVAVCDSVYKTNHLGILFEQVGRAAGQKVYGKLGFAQELVSQFDRQAVDQLLIKKDTHELADFFIKTLAPEELKNFIALMDPRDAALLLTDNMFGEHMRNQVKRHDFTPGQTSEILSRLNAEQYHHILRDLSPDALQLYFDKLPDDDRKKLVAGQSFGPRNNLQIHPDDLQKLVRQLPADQQQRIMSGSS